MVLDRRCRAFRFPRDRDGVLDVDEEIIAPAEPQLCRDDFSCEIVVGSWVGISQVKIKSRLSRSALLLFVLRVIAETRSIVIQRMELRHLLV